MTMHLLTERGSLRGPCLGSSAPRKPLTAVKIKAHALKTCKNVSVETNLTCCPPSAAVWKRAGLWCPDGREWARVPLPGPPLPFSRAVQARSSLVHGAGHLEGLPGVAPRAHLEPRCPVPAAGVTCPPWRCHQGLGLGQVPSWLPPGSGDDGLLPTAPLRGRRAVTERGAWVGVRLPFQKHQLCPDHSGRPSASPCGSFQNLEEI